MDRGLLVVVDLDPLLHDLVQDSPPGRHGPQLFKTLSLNSKYKKNYCLSNMTYILVTLLGNRYQVLVKLLGKEEVIPLDDVAVADLVLDIFPVS